MCIHGIYLTKSANYQALSDEARVEVVRGVLQQDLLKSLDCLVDPAVVAVVALAHLVADGDEDADGDSLESETLQPLDFAAMRHFGFRFRSAMSKLQVQAQKTNF